MELYTIWMCIINKNQKCAGSLSQTPIVPGGKCGCESTPGAPFMRGMYAPAMGTSTNAIAAAGGKGRNDAAAHPGMV